MNPKLSFLESERTMPLTALPLRTTIAELSTGVVMLMPASTISESRYRTFDRVTDIVVPNLFHTEGVIPASKAIPNARLWGPPGIEKKRPDLKWNVLGRDAWPHDAELFAFELAGMPFVSEFVFLHKASRTLVVADLAFNIREPKGAFSWVIFGLFGTYKRFGVSKFFMRAVRDRAAFSESIRRILASDFDALVPAHGAIVESGANEKLAAALRERDVL